MKRFSIFQRFRDRSIRYKLFLSYFALVLFFLGLFLAINSIVVTRESRDQVLRSAEYLFAQASANLEFKTESVRNLLYALTTNTTVQELFERPTSYYDEDIGRWPIDAQTLEKLVYPIDRNPYVMAVHVYMKRGLASVFENETIVRWERAEQSSWYSRFFDADRRIFWYRGESDTGSGDASLVHAVKSVYESQNINALSGLVQLDLSLGMLSPTLDDSLLTERTVACLVDSSGRIITSAGPVGTAEAEDLWAEVLSIRGPDTDRELWGTVSVGGRSYLVGSRVIASSDWTFILAVPNQDVAQMSARPAQLMLLVFLVMTPLPPLLAFFVSRSATRRIQNLIVKMDRVVSGDFSATLDPGNNDELGRLTERFNYMMLEVEQLLDEKFVLGKEVKNLELRALQAQINPHFLYNTLDLINWMAVRRGADDIANVVNSLSRFYRLSLSGGEDTVSVREEVEHAGTYVAIQNMRYENRIRLDVQVPESLMDSRIVKLVIQPLVENSIFHGIMAKPDERGAVWIEATTQNGDIVFSVRDDGVGIPKSELQSIREGTHNASDHHGYGVRNIHERLELNYGSGYGLKFESTLNVGTTVVFRVPMKP
jgi:two-component system, sensor histidine kinase YesM